MGNNTLTDSQRLDKVVRYTGMTHNAFARSIGLSRSENIYQIKRSKYGISKDIAELITARYPEISKAWLLTGEGEMIIGLNAGQYYIKCYDADLLSVAVQKTLPAPNYHLEIPRFRGADFAACSFDRAMDRIVPVGSTVMLARIESEDIVPGYGYVVVTAQYTLLRTLHREPFEREIRLSAPDLSYEDMIIDISDIISLYRVLGYVNYFK